MGRKSQTVKLNIYIQGHLVGEYTKSPNGSTEFRYDKLWVKRGFAISQSLPLVTTAYKGNSSRAYFENLLPDLKEVRESIAAKVKATSSDHFDLISALGHDCIGALIFLDKSLDIDIKSIKDNTPKGDKLTDKEIKDMILNLKSQPLGLSSELSEFRISLAGVQEKTALLYWKGSWQRPIGMTPTTHIIKPAMKYETGGLDMSTSVHNEYFCMKVCEAFGLETAQVDIEKFDDEVVLVVDRFDRVMKNNIIYRRPQEDMCQALGYFSERKYQADGGPTIKDLVSVLQTSVERQKDLESLFKSLLVYYILGAIDGHAKNYSIRYVESGYQLAPLYDILSIYPALTVKEIKIGKYKMAFSIGNSNHYASKRIYRKHFIETAKFCQISAHRSEEIIDSTLLSVKKKVWETIELSDHLDLKVRDKIISGILINARKLQ